MRVRPFLAALLVLMSLGCSPKLELSRTEMRLDPNAPCRPRFYVLPPLSDHRGAPVLSIALVVRAELTEYSEARPTIVAAMAAGTNLWSQILAYHETLDSGEKDRIVAKINTILGASYVLDLLTTTIEIPAFVIRPVAESRTPDSLPKKLAATKRTAELPS